jgi:hypothetical protein
VTADMESADERSEVDLALLFERFDQALDEAFAWAASLTPTQHEQLNKVEGWLHLLADQVLITLGRIHELGVDQTGWNWCFVRATFNVRFRQAAEAMKASGATWLGLAFEALMALPALAAVTADEVVAAAMLRPQEHVRRYLALVETAPQLGLLLEGMGGPWSGSTEDLDVLARLLES